MAKYESAGCLCATGGYFLCPKYRRFIRAAKGAGFKRYGFADAIAAFEREAKKGPLSVHHLMSESLDLLEKRMELEWQRRNIED